ncbi:MAG: type IV pili twitching motility protein PilT, partial [Candidatus Liptonbacteria bacterium CG11_big_fil_rev_8_21_14_0_20_35_14]
MPTDFKIKLNELLLTTARQGASDLHIAVGRKPTLRVDGKLLSLEQEQILTPDAASGLVSAMLTKEQLDYFIRNRQYDFSYTYQDKARFRVNVYFQRGYMSAALRLIPAQIRSIEELQLPSIFHDFTKVEQGFFLVVGPAGQGKSTTLAALLDEVNHSRTDHI